MFKIEQIVDIFSKYDLDTNTLFMEYMSHIFNDILNISGNKVIDIKYKIRPTIGLFCDIKDNVCNKWINDSIRISLINISYNTIIKLYNDKELIFNYPQIIEFCKFIDLNLVNITDEKVLKNIKYFKQYLFTCLLSNNTILKVNDFNVIFSHINNFCKIIFTNSKCVYIDCDDFYFTSIDNDIIDKFDWFNIPYEIGYGNDLYLIRRKQLITIDKNWDVKYSGFYKNENLKYNKIINNRLRLKKLKKIKLCLK